MKELKKKSEKFYPLFFIERIVLFLLFFLSLLSYSQIYVSSSDALFISEETEVYSCDSKVNKVKVEDLKVKEGEIFIIGDVEIFDTEHQVFAKAAVVLAAEDIDRSQIHRKKVRNLNENLSLKKSSTVKESKPEFTPKLNSSESSFDFVLSSNSYKAIASTNPYKLLNGLLLSSSELFLPFTTIRSKVQIFYNPNYQGRVFNYCFSIRPPPFSIG